MRYFKKFTKKPTGILKIITMSSLPALLVGCSDDTIDDEWFEYSGTDGDDEMIGTAGAVLETFHSSLGADKMTAKSPAVVDYSKSNAAVTVNLDGTVGKGGHAEGDVLNGIIGLIGSDFDDVLSGNGGYSPGISGRGGDDILMGTASYDSLLGDDGDDKLYGYDGTDILTGGTGADVLDGGAGKDRVTYKNSTAGVTINLLTGAASGGEAQGDILISIESVNGSGFDDYITGNDADNSIVGFDGADQILGLSGHDNLSGGAGNDQIIGGDGNDSISGGQGDDILHGGAGDDAFYSAFGLQGSNEVNGGAGTDLLSEIESDSKNSFVYVIQETDYKILVTYGDNVYILNSIETVRLMDQYGSNIVSSLDVKDIWSELASDEQAKFAGEVEFLSWLGNDVGYNYEGL